MNGNLNDSTSIYLQIAAMLEDNIVRDLLLEEEQAPSTNELAKAFSINPATAAKGLNLLVDEGILYKKRGIGMFVAAGSKQKGKIYGLIGRNGAGKTTLLSILTAQNTHDSGLVTYNGERVWENQKALDEICFSRELSPMLLFGQNTLKVKEYLRAAALYYPHWDKEYAARLIEMFGLDTKKKIYKLSKGMMSMVTIVLALASRAPIPILDEPVAGLDVVAREQFYDVLLADYAETGRTFIISTHIIEEAAGVFEDIIFIDNGRVIETGNCESFVAQFHYVSGRDEDVARACAGLQVIHEEGLGRSRTACVRGSLDTLRRSADGLDVDISGVTLQKVFVYLTGGHKEGE